MSTVLHVCVVVVGRWWLCLLAELPSCAGALTQSVSADNSHEVYADPSADKQQHQWHELVHIKYEQSM